MLTLRLWFRVVRRLFVVCWLLLFVARWFLFVVCRLTFFVVCCLLWRVCGLLRVDYLFARRSLFVVRCLLVV